MDHLCELLKSFKVEQFNNIRHHKTKCAAIIKHVIAPVILSDMLKVIGSNKYSVIVDESTDIGNNKWMSVCIRFVNEEGEVSTEFLGMFLVEEATAVKLFEGLCQFLAKLDLNIQNILAIGTDGANNLCGKHHSLFTLLKEVNPSIMLIKCICHALHLCSSEACKSLPSNIEFLVREIYNYFSNSSLRTIKYKRVFDLVNLGPDCNKFRKLVQISGTRWLSYGAAVKRLLDQWLELKTHFSIIATSDNERTAQLIYELLSDEDNRMLLLGVYPIINEINILNLKFQKNNLDAGSVNELIFLCILSLATKILKPEILIKIKDDDSVEKLQVILDSENSYLSYDLMNFGYNFENEIISNLNVLKIKSQCFLFLKKLLLQLAKRLPQNMKFFREFIVINPKTCSNLSLHKPFSDLVNFIKPLVDGETNSENLESQWSKIPLIKWNYDEMDVQTFWKTVFLYEDVSGSKPFLELSKIILTLLSVPTSNACVERVFSIMNFIKMKIRNKMQYELLEALIRINMYFKNNTICCHSFVPSCDMLNRFNSQTMYPTKNPELEKLDEELLNDFVLD